VIPQVGQISGLSGMSAARDTTGLMQLILRIVLAFLSPTSDADAEALHRFSPNEVTVDRAHDHIWAARVAAAVYGVDPDLSLAISWHESRFQAHVVGPAVNGRRACGAMQPVPTGKCEWKTILEQYLEGTEHWAVWKRAGDVRNDHEALLGYAGGYRLLRSCRLGPVLRHKTYGDDLCLTPEVFEGIRARILRARQGAS
jgi:hypothetical protein